MWRTDDGWAIAILGPSGGGPIAEPMQPEAGTVTPDLTARRVHFAGVIHGRTVGIVAERLQPDGRHLAGTGTVIRAGGTARIAPSLPSYPAVGPIDVRP